MKLYSFKYDWIYTPSHLKINILSMIPILPGDEIAILSERDKKNFTLLGYTDRSELGSDEYHLLVSNEKMMISNLKQTSPTVEGDIVRFRRDKKIGDLLDL